MPLRTFASVVLLAVAVAAHAAATTVEIAAPAAPNNANFACEESLRPDVLVVQGGLSADSVSPKEGSAQIERELAAIEALAKSSGGSLVALERLRAARNVKPGANSDAPNDHGAPFQQIQRIELRVPREVDVDALLEQLFKLGLDRYGTDLRFGHYASSEFHGLTHYRYTDLRARLDALRQRCREPALTTICGADAHCRQAAYVNASLKTSSYADRTGSFQEKYINLPEGYRGQDLPQDYDVEPAGDVPIAFRYTGSVTRPSP